ncbi:MAG: thermonuclease family protein [Pseudomonadota bacterium]
MLRRDAPGILIPGAFLLALAWPLPAAADPCLLPGPGSAVAVSRVVDGDTLILADRRRIRLIGVNAPELGRDGKPDQPLARAAREFLAELLGGGDPAAAPAARVRLHPGVEPRDRHGRWLAHLEVEGRSVERELVRRGLAYHVALPPNLALAACLRAAEQAARAARVGLWSAAAVGPVPSERIAAGGYQRVRGRVERVLFADAWWIEFAGNFRGVIYPEHQGHWRRQAVAAWRGQVIEVRGWVYRGRRGEWRMRLPTPDARLP